MKYTEAVFLNSIRKLSRFEITKMLIAVLRRNFAVSFIIISFALVGCSKTGTHRTALYSSSRTAL